MIDKEVLGGFTMKYSKIDDSTIIYVGIICSDIVYIFYYSLETFHRRGARLFFFVFRKKKKYIDRTVTNETGRLFYHRSWSCIMGSEWKNKE